MPTQKLSDEEITSVLRELTDWTVKEGKLHRTFRFPAFAHAIGFMTIASIEIDKRDHHPEWQNIYNRVTVDLTTHDAGGITRKDSDLARMLDGIAAKLA